MKALVTGGAGFIGSHLVDELVKRKYEVIVLDNLSTGNIKNLKSSIKKIKFVKCDLEKNKNLNFFFRKVDYIFHFAALSEVNDSIKNPDKYYKANVLSTLNILNSIKEHKIKKFIYSASASCYGNSKEIPTSEEAKIKILSPYAFTKRMSEKLIIKQAKIKKFSFISLRFFNVYGPRSRTSGPYSPVINIFAKQKLAKKPFTISGDGLQTRSFVYISDVIDILIKSAKSKISNEIFNVGGQKSIRIKNIAKKLKGKITYIPKRKGEPRQSSANISKIKRYLKWKPKISINTGMNIILKEIKKNEK